MAIAVEKIACDDLAVVARYRCQRRARSRRIARRVDDGVGDALQELVEPKPAILDVNVSRGQIEFSDIRDPSCGVNGGPV